MMLQLCWELGAQIQGPCFEPMIEVPSEGLRGSFRRDLGVPVRGLQDLVRTFSRKPRIAEAEERQRLRRELDEARERLEAVKDDNDSWPRISGIQPGPFKGFRAPLAALELIHVIIIIGQGFSTPAWW